MKLNVRKLDATIEKLQQLRRLATDPALAPFVEITGIKDVANGNGSSSHADSNGHEKLKDKVLEACAEIAGAFTIKEVCAKMRSQGYVFTSDTSEKSVANILRGISKEGTLTVVEQGKGRRATTYKV